MTLGSGTLGGPLGTPPRTGVLPFRVDGEVRDRSGVVLALVGCDVWALSQIEGEGGEIYSHAGVASLAASIAVEERNMILHVEGVDYRIVRAVEWRELGYVELELRHPKAG